MHTFVSKRDRHVQLKLMPWLLAIHLETVCTYIGGLLGRHSPWNYIQSRWLQTFALLRLCPWNFGPGKKVHRTIFLGKISPTLINIGPLSQSLLEMSIQIIMCTHREDYILVFRWNVFTTVPRGWSRLWVVHKYVYLWYQFLQPELSVHFVLGTSGILHVHMQWTQTSSTAFTDDSVACCSLL